MLYGTPEQNANGKYDAALAYVQWMFMRNAGGDVDLPFDMDSVKVYASSRYVTGKYTNVENLGGDNAMDLDDFISTLKNLGFTPDYPTIERGSSSNFTQFSTGFDSNYFFVDFSNAEYSDSDNVFDSGMSTADYIKSLENENGNNTSPERWMTKWLQSQIEQDAPSNVKGWGEPSAQNNSNNENKARSVSSTKTSYNVGLNVGAGVEFVIKDRFTVGVEYRYTDVKVSGAKFQLHNIGAKFGVEFL